MIGAREIQQPPHIPVMLREVLEGMAPRDGGVYVDGTFGAGGHTQALLDAADCRVFAIDRDPGAEGFAAALVKKYGDRFTFISGRFSEMEQLLRTRGIARVDGILLDIGVSSMQLDTPRRGFSFMHDGPLDMRMGEGGQDASDFVNHAKEDELAGVLFKYGGEHKSRQIARAIVLARSANPITRTRELADIVKQAVRGYNDAIHPATRTFQALRIWVNGELDELEMALSAAEKVLNPGGRLVVITFHSGEDQIAKHFMNIRAGRDEGVSRHLPLPIKDRKEPSFTLVTRKAQAPSEEEVEANPRARSAKVRVAERTNAPVWIEKGGRA